MSFHSQTDRVSERNIVANDIISGSVWKKKTCLKKNRTHFFFFLKKTLISGSNSIATPSKVSAPATPVGTPNKVSAANTPEVASKSFVSDSVLNSDCSNSSWAEMASYIVGCYQMHPITRDTKVLFILKYLRPVGEYQESLANVFEYKALDLIFHYINVRKTSHARLSFEALRFLGSLLFHKKFCLEFVVRGGMPILLQVSG